MTQPRLAFAACSSILLLKVAIMGMIKRQLGDRRLGFPMEFPLIDSDEVLVPRDRRIHHQRRRANITLEELEILLSQMLLKNLARK
jgi:hypothetical protein